MGRSQLVGQGVEERKRSTTSPYIGAIYRGSKQHVALKAGGNDEVQLKVAQQGVVTTSEKYVVAHSVPVSIQFVAVTWNDLPPITPRETGDDDSDNMSTTANPGTDMRNPMTQVTATSVSILPGNRLL